MSILNAFDDQSPAMINPEDIVSRQEGFPETVIAVFDSEFIDSLRTMCPVDDWEMAHGGRLPVCRFSYKGHMLGIYETGMGGSLAVDLMEQIFARGAEKVLIFGACGVLAPELTEGHLILPTAAYRDEGTSYHYMPAGEYVDIPTAAKLAAILDELHYPYIQGKTWTTDAFFRETKNKVAARRQEGCLTVEMECASLMAMAHFREREVYQFLFAQDSLSGAAWEKRTLGVPASSELQRLLNVALETAIRL